MELRTNLGPIEIELDPAHAPQTVHNFLDYTLGGFYAGTIFHRVIPGFMIQGGGFRSGLQQKPTGAPIRNEADNGLHNLTGTVAMARKADPDSATAQFFINTADNPTLDFRDHSKAGAGYCVFGRVIHGMDVVRRIEATPIQTVGIYQNVPVADVVIEKVTLLNDAGTASDNGTSSIDDARFAEIVARYRSARPRPAITEDLRRLGIMAATAVRDRRFYDALQNYNQALQTAPWWPEAHFNKALILGELQRYSDAIGEMRRYLQLLPEAPNARSAQDKIYEWESRNGGALPTGSAN